MGNEEPVEGYPERGPLAERAVLAAIERRKGHVLTTGISGCTTTSIQMRATTVREGASADTPVQFDTGNVTVPTWGDGAVEMRVTPGEETGPASVA